MEMIGFSRLINQIGISRRAVIIQFFLSAPHPPLLVDFISKFLASDVSRAILYGSHLISNAYSRDFFTSPELNSPPNFCGKEFYYFSAYVYS